MKRHDKPLENVVQIKHGDKPLEKEERRDSELISTRKWPTSWFWQLLVLTVRTFRQSRHVILSKLNLIQTILLAMIVSIIWFQVPEEERSINDRNGYVSDDELIVSIGVMYCWLQFFFTNIFWAFQPLIVATLSCKSM